MPINLIVAGGFALLFLYLCWLRSRGTSGELVIESFWLRLIVYESAFVLGESYLIVLFADLKWPRTLLFLAIASWGVLLGSGVWHRDHRRKSD